MAFMRSNMKEANVFDDRNPHISLESYVTLRGFFLAVFYLCVLDPFFYQECLAGLLERGTLAPY